ncbi:erythromycin esterase family protein [Nocardia sp. NPDC049149]|uniref:erythromycin esterase family protein n=1 Tax=Nocardia sp. NPDC049149 TaxID=3364315 RepID=UPI0037123F46
MSPHPSLRDIALDLDAAHLGSTIGRFLYTLDQPPTLLGLGEPTHGVEAFLQLRNQLFRYLVEQHGYRSIAFESSCLAALVLDDYVRTGAGSRTDVLATGFSHGLGDPPATRELISWIRDYNADRDPGAQIRCYGFDAPTEVEAAPSPRTTLLAAHAYLTRHLPAERVPHDAHTLDTWLGDDAEWSNPAAMFDAAHSIGDTERARLLRLAADDILQRCTLEAPGLREVSSDNEFERAFLFARTAVGLLRYHAAMATPGSERFATLLALRDAIGADNLLAIARIEKHRGPCLVFAHNSHLQRAESAMSFAGADQHWWSAGALAASTLGTEYACIATDFDRRADASAASEFDAAAARKAVAAAARDAGVAVPQWAAVESEETAVAERSDVPAPQEDTHSLQTVLAAATTGRALFPARALATALDSDVRVRPSMDYRVAHFDPAQLDGVDAVAFIETI